MGRNKKLLNARDHKIFERYIFWTEIKRIRFDDAIKILSSEEFFVSECVIISVVRKGVQEGWVSSLGKSPSKSNFSGFRFKPNSPST